MVVIINTSSDEDCVVTGALSLTLRLSSFFGLAPLRFVSLQNGYRVSVSHNRALYGYILITLLNIIGCITLLADVKRHISDITWSYGLFSVSIIVLVILCSQGSYYAVRRMKNLITYLKCLGEIKTNMGVEIGRISKQNKVTSVIVVVHLFVIIALLLGELFIHFENIINDPISFWFRVFYIHVILVYFLQAQIVVMFLEIQSSLDVVSKTIDEMLSMDEFGYPPSLTFSNDVRCFTRAYITACDVVSKLNKEDGIIVIFVMCYLIARILTIGCSLGSISSSSTQYILAFLIFWSFINLLDFIAFIEGFNLINDEVTNIKVKMCKLMSKATDIGCRIPIELELLYKQLILNKMQFSPLSIFTLERTLTIRIFSGILTYFFFIIQIKGTTP